MTILNFDMPQGATFPAVLTWKIDGSPVDLTSYSARMDVRKRPQSDVILALTEGSGITLGGSAGTITLDVSAEDTAAITPGQYVYDLELYNGDYVKRLIQGTVSVSAEVTHD